MPDWFRPSLWRCLRHREGLPNGYDRAAFLGDLSAGLLVAVVALPLSMGLAIASGAKPEQGLYTAIIGGLLVSLLGGSRMQIAGPAGAFVGLCATGVAQYGYGGLALATMMAGVLLVVMGIGRLGKAISYIPTPVVIGFTTGIAVIIASTQLAPACGIAEKTLGHTHERIVHLWQHLGEVGWQAPAVCLATIGGIVALRLVRPRWPGALIAIVVVSAVTWGLGWESDGVLATIKTRFQDLPHGLPTPAFPDAGLREGWNLGDLLIRLKELSGLALAIALLGAIESLLSAVVADGMSGDRHDSNTELIGQGVANLISPLFLGLPVTGVIARTSTNIRAGARTPVAGIIKALTILLILVVAAPLVIHVPLAALAGVLLVVCWYMAELRHWPHILRAGGSDAFLLPLAFGLTVFIDLVWAVVVGVLLAMFFFVRRMAETTQVERQEPASEILPVGAKAPAGVEVYEIRGPFFFGAATLLRDIDAELDDGHRALVLRLRQVPFIDATAAFQLRELITSCRSRHIRVIISELHGRAWDDLQRHGLTGLLGPENLAADLASALVAADSHVESVRLRKAGGTAGGTKGG